MKRRVINIASRAVLVIVTGCVVALIIGPETAAASQTDCLSYGYACTPGYTGSNAAGTWAWTHYGGSYAQTPNGYHNCTLYAAWRLAENGMSDPGNWGNAVDWAGHNGGGNNTPAVGAIAWWGSEVAGGLGHVAYVDAVNGSQVHVVADNFSYSAGYTDSGWIAASSVDKFLHPHDLDGGNGLANGSFVQVAGSPEIYRIVGGAPLYVSNWNAVGGPQPFTVISQQQFAALPSVPADGTFIWSTATGAVYRIAGGAPLYVSSWNAVGGQQAATAIDQWDIDNTANPAAHLRAYPADGTFINTSAGHVYRFAGGAPFRVSSWSVFGGTQPSTTVDQWDVDNAADPHAHVRLVPADGTIVEGLPSHSYWSFSSGYRSATGASGSAVTVDDAGLGAYPQAGTVGPAGLGGGGTSGLGGSSGAAGAGSGVGASPPAAVCLVPRLRHMTLAQAKRALHRSHCGLGRVHWPRHVPRRHVLRVWRQSAASGGRHPAGYRVDMAIR